MLLIVDGMSVLKTIFGGIANYDNAYAYNFVIQLTAAVKKFSPDSIIVCWEGGDGGRKNLLPNYKSDRTISTDAARLGRDQIQKLLPMLGVLQAVSPGYEADDLAGHLTRNWPGKMLLFTGDRDWLQLINERVSVYQKVKQPRGIKVKNSKVVINLENFQDLTGWLNPAQFLLAKTGITDKSDNIPGIPGISEENVIAYFQKTLTSEAKRDKIDEFYRSPQQKRNLELMDIVSPRIALPVRWEPIRISQETTLAYLNELGFASITKDFQKFWDAYACIRKIEESSTQ